MVCVILASGAAFGMAAQAALHHLGLDFGSIHRDMIAGHAATSRSAVAWWAWWVVAVAAFLVGPLTAALARNHVANWWLMRNLRLCAMAVGVLAFAAVAELRPAPSSLASTTSAALGLLVVLATTLLAWLGARVLGGVSLNGASLSVSAPMRVPPERIAPIPRALPADGGGSAKPGLPLLRRRRWHRLVPGSFSFARLGIAAVPAFALFALVSVLGGGTVLLDALAPNAARELVAELPEAGAAGPARTLALAMLPTEPPRRVVMPAVALLDAPPPPPIEPTVPRQRAISVAAGYGGPIAESDLTFTKGYSRRRAAQLVANMTSLPSIPQLTAAIDIKKIRATSLRLTQDRRVTGDRQVSSNRTWDRSRQANWDHGWDRSWDRQVTTDRRVQRRGADNRHRTPKRARSHDRYDRYTDYNGYARQGRHERHRARDRYGDNRFARAEPGYRRF